MRITINQAALDRHHEQLGLLRLSARAIDRDAPSIVHLAQLALRLDVPLSEVGSIARSVVDGSASAGDGVRGDGVVRLALM